MNKTVLYIISFIILVSFTITIVGVPINYHFCGKTGHKTANLITNPECACETESGIEVDCHNDGDSIDNCTHCKTETTNDITLAVHSDNCCSDKSEIYSIDDDFISNSKNKIILDFSIIQSLIEKIENSEFYNDIKCTIEEIKLKTHSFIRKIVLYMLLQSFSSEKSPDHINN